MTMYDAKKSAMLNGVNMDFQPLNIRSKKQAAAANAARAH